MSLDYSIASIMSRLVDWGGLPKYQLERRVDIFITPFLPRYVRRRLEGPAALVTPEFPLPRWLKDPAPPQTEEEEDALTINVDYLFAVRRKPPRKSAWVMLELKTEPGSFDKKQYAAYRKACGMRMEDVLGELQKVRDASRGQAWKYDRLLKSIRTCGFEADRLELAYLMPSQVKPPDEQDEDNPTHFFSLQAFADQPLGWVEPEHRDLWPHVRDLLRAIEAAQRVRGKA